jgi:Trk K+ transport system NAD-binding subunit
MPNSLRSNIQAAAAIFTSSVLDAIRGASLEELLAESSAGGRRGPGRPSRAVAAAGAAAGSSRAVRTTRSGRLKRRSADDIVKALDRVVALVKRHKAGLRAEQIREELRMQSKEMPRVLKEGLAKKKLKSRGQKRATTYTAA